MFESRPDFCDAGLHFLKLVDSINKRKETHVNDTFGDKFIEFCAAFANENRENKDATWVCTKTLSSVVATSPDRYSMRILDTMGPLLVHLLKIFPPDNNQKLREM